MKTRYNIGHVHTIYSDGMKKSVFMRIDKKSALRAYYHGYKIVLVPHNFLPGDFIIGNDSIIQYDIINGNIFENEIANFKSKFEFIANTKTIDFYVPVKIDYINGHKNYFYDYNFIEF